jgi:membrane protease YdiL (CAAX protease family)
MLCHPESRRRMESPQEILLQVWTFAALALGTSLVALGLWLSQRRRPLFPPQRYRAVPWTGLELTILLLLVFAAIPYLVQAILDRSGFFAWLYGANFRIADLANGAPQADPLAQARVAMWHNLFTCPLQIICIPTLLRLGSGTMPYQLGLTTHRWRANVVLGFLAWLLLTPVVHGLYFLVNSIYLFWQGIRPESHPIDFLARHRPSSTELGVLVFLVVVLAPIAEELIFRGLLLNWLATRPWGGQLAMAGSLAIAYNQSPAWAGIWPMVFVLAMVPGFVYVSVATWSWLPDPDATRAIYGTGLLFAVFHTSVWPSPIPLFVLGLGLGYLAHRSQSLVGPMVLHGLFNAVSAVTFFYAAPEPPPRPNGTDATSAVQRLPSLSTVNGVPGSWLPRRTYPSAIAVPNRGDRTDEVTDPTSTPSRNSLAPWAAAFSLPSLRPTSDRFTWPYVWMRATVS